MIVSIVNSKGGVGKSTIAVHLATAFAAHGSTLLIDGDAQASAADWAEWRRERADAGAQITSPTTVKLTGRAILNEGGNLIKAHDHTVIDSGGHDALGTRAAIMLSQQVIVPVGAASFDAAALSQTLAIIDECKVARPDIRIRVVLCRVGHNTTDAGNMVAFLESQGITPMAARIGERVAFKRAITTGSTVLEGSGVEQAAAEFRSFFDELTSA